MNCLGVPVKLSYLNAPKRETNGIMKPLLLFIVTIAFAATLPVNASTLVLDITPDYVRAHSNEVSVKVAKDKSGLLAFTVVFTFDEPKFVVTSNCLCFCGGRKSIGRSEPLLCVHKPQ